MREQQGPHEVYVLVWEMRNHLSKYIGRTFSISGALCEDSTMVWWEDGAEGSDSVSMERFLPVEAVKEPS